MGLNFIINFITLQSVLYGSTFNAYSFAMANCLHDAAAPIVDEARHVLTAIINCYKPDYRLSH